MQQQQVQQQQQQQQGAHWHTPHSKHGTICFSLELQVCECLSPSSRVQRPYTATRAPPPVRHLAQP